MSEKFIPPSRQESLEPFEQDYTIRERQKEYIKNGNFLEHYGAELRDIFETCGIEWSDNPVELAAALREIVLQHDNVASTDEQKAALFEAFAQMGFSSPVEELDNVSPELADKARRNVLNPPFDSNYHSVPEGEDELSSYLPRQPKTDLSDNFDNDTGVEYDLYYDYYDYDYDSTPSFRVVSKFDNPNDEWYESGDSSVLYDNERMAYTQWWLKYVSGRGKNVDACRQPHLLRLQRLTARIAEEQGVEYEEQLGIIARAPDKDIDPKVMLYEILRLLDMDVADAKKTSPDASAESQPKESSLEAEATTEQSVPDDEL